MLNHCVSLLEKMMCHGGVEEGARLYWKLACHETLTESVLAESFTRRTTPPTISQAAGDPLAIESPSSQGRNMNITEKFFTKSSKFFEEMEIKSLDRRTI